MTDEDELKKPRVEVTNEGTADEARDQWRQAAFVQARRANKLRDELRALSVHIEKVLASDSDEEDTPDGLV